MDGFLFAIDLLHSTPAMEFGANYSFQHRWHLGGVIGMHILAL
jgi:hypothetical protein